MGALGTALGEQGAAVGAQGNTGLCFSRYVWEVYAHQLQAREVMLGAWRVLCTGDLGGCMANGAEGKICVWLPVKAYTLTTMQCCCSAETKPS